ncbi:MAG: Transaldolase [uncultured Solirubrobacteraceae bacterium]|uniref:Transaldolase n=1 Tax=uncultured Solirubrobacteraceae bacterium TaxID=1162706 RepID=A0A6J4R3F3_9ACTN|nr:MAG: Transaldolase [uncultured Solirubrobacteraceae bacterium]
MATNHLHEIQALGQSVWLDNISRGLIEDGDLARLVEDGVSGVTSNPTIFDKAMSDTSRYDAAFADAISAGLDDPREVFFRVGGADIRDACDILAPVYERTGGKDGHVSFELPPDVADDVDGSVEVAKRLHADIDRANLMIKVPGTAAGVRAFEELTAAGVSVNVTLLFAVKRYEEVAEAYLSGLERRVAAGEPVDRLASVASFFVSRVDSKVDKALEGMGRDDLAGRAAVANAKLAYESFRRIFSGQRWDALAAKGANPQRPLWASTGTKNPAYPDTLYVDNLIGPDTVNTMPDATLAAARDHAKPARTVDADLEAAHALVDELRAIGVPFDRIVEQELTEEGLASFAKSFDSLIETVDGQLRQTATQA